MKSVPVASRDFNLQSETLSFAEIDRLVGAESHVIQAARGCASVTGGGDFPAFVQRPEAGEAGESPARQSPPTLLGGVKCQEGVKEGVGVHWIQGTVPWRKLDGLIEYLDRATGERGKRVRWGRFRYDRGALWETFGIQVYYDSDFRRAKQVHNERCTLVVPGSALDLLSASGLHRLCVDLCHSFWLLATRVDVYVDDFLRVVSPSDVYVECERGNLSGFRLFRADSPRKMTIGQSVKVGDAVVLGRRGKQGAGKYLRVYDKNLETLGQRDCVRWEVEFSDKRARAVMHRLTMAEGVEEFGALCGSLVGGSVEFYDRAGSQERHLERLQRVEWWQRLLDRIGWLRVRAARRFSSVGRVAAWVTSQVAASLAMLTEVCGGDAWTYLGEVVRQGQQRMSGRHRKMIRAYLSECDQGSLLAEVA